MKRCWRGGGLAALALLTLLILPYWGCGSGGGKPKGDLTGLVTDVDGQAVAGATVRVGSLTTTSLSNGTFVIENISGGLQTVRAEATIRGNRWSGETVVDLVGGEKNRSINVTISDERFQGSIAGTVIDPNGFVLPGAKIFVLRPKVSGEFGEMIASTMAVTRNDGTYEVRRLTPGVTYTVTCSLAGYVNETRRVTVNANQTSAASFALAFGTSQGPIPAPENVFATAFTISGTISRADSGAQGVYDWLKRHYRKKRGLPENPTVRNIERKTTGRLTPSGSVIEIDLDWTYASYEDLFGYAIKRGTNRNALSVTALVRDPLTRFFFDVDQTLTPDVVYYYTVHCLDTIDFPDRGTLGPASQIVSANPLGPIRAQSPAQGASVNGDPTFQWTAVNGAANYQIYVWDRFPDLQNAQDTNNGVTPIWPANFNNPGSSLVPAPRTSQVYAGPVLQRGRTYYWMVVAEDSEGAAFSATQIARFVAR